MDKVLDTDTVVETKDNGLDLDTLFPAKEGQDTTAQTDETKDTPSSGDAEDEDPKELRAKLEGLTKELARVRKGKAESSVEVQEVREQLANLQGQLEVMSKGSATNQQDANRLARYSDEQLLQGQTEWEDSLYEQRDAIRRARADNDETAFNKATRDLGTAKATLNSIRKELMDRSKRVGAEQAKAQSETSELVNEISGLYEDAYKTLPDLKDKDSELWQAGNAVFNRHPKLMKQLGPLAELVATSIAMSENPKLIPGGGAAKVKEARKDLLTEINAQAEKSLIQGKGSPNKKVITNFDAMPKTDFESLIHKLKQG